jgi:hypothetical protein
VDFRGFFGKLPKYYGIFGLFRMLREYIGISGFFRNIRISLQRLVSLETLWGSQELNDLPKFLAFLK